MADVVGPLSLAGVLVLAVLYVHHHRAVKELRRTAERVAELGVDPSQALAPRRAPAESSAGSPSVPVPEPRLTQRELDARRAAEGPRGRGRIVAVIAVAVIAVAAVVVLLTRGDTSPQPAGGGGKTTPTRVAPVLQPAETTVAVLNGTEVPGLAEQIATRAQGFNYRRGTVANADGPAEVSAVAYPPGRKEAAQRLAKRLGIAQVVPLQPSAQAVAGADADIVVIVGSDEADTAG